MGGRNRGRQRAALSLLVPCPLPLLCSTCLGEQQPPALLSHASLCRDNGARLLGVARETQWAAQHGKLVLMTAEVLCCAVLCCAVLCCAVHTVWCRARSALQECFVYASVLESWCGWQLWCAAVMHAYSAAAEGCCTCLLLPHTSCALMWGWADIDTR